MRRKKTIIKPRSVRRKKKNREANPSHRRAKHQAKHTHKNPPQPRDPCWSQSEVTNPQPITLASKTQSKTHTHTHTQKPTTTQRPMSITIQSHKPTTHHAGEQNTKQNTHTQTHHNPKTHADHNPKSQTPNPKTYTHTDHNRKSQTHNQTHADRRLWDRTERREQPKVGKKKTRRRRFNRLVMMKFVRW